MKTFDSIQPTIYFVFVLIIIVGFFYYSKLLIYKEGLASMVEVPDVKFPFKNVRDENGNKLNVIAISAPFREEEHEKIYQELKEEGLHFLGISSYSEFPEKLSNPYESRFHEERNHDYLSMVSTWAHCFREPSINLKLSGLPLILMTEADLKNTELYKYDPKNVKEYDFMYVCLDDDETGKTCKPGWQWHNRNWDLGKKCLKVMCRDYNLKGVIVGRQSCKFSGFCKGIVKTLPFMEFNEFQKEMQKCRFLFVPNISDASPRVITESLCYNMPVLVNENIVGGWHNVISGVTGEFFTDENNMRPALDKLLENYDSYTPNKWYVENRGRLNSGKEFADFIKLHYPDLNLPDMKYADI